MGLRRLGTESSPDSPLPQMPGRRREASCASGNIRRVSRSGAGVILIASARRSRLIKRILTASIAGSANAGSANAGSAVITRRVIVSLMQLEGRYGGRAFSIGKRRHQGRGIAELRVQHTCRDVANLRVSNGVQGVPPGARPQSLLLRSAAGRFQLEPNQSNRLASNSISLSKRAAVAVPISSSPIPEQTGSRRSPWTLLFSIAGPLCGGSRSSWRQFGQPKLVSRCSTFHRQRAAPLAASLSTM
jgi:hypothetical protein